MKKLMMILCTILCANILAAQIQFTSGGLKYELIVFNNSVEVAQQNSSDISGSVIIPSTVTYNGTTYSVTSIGKRAFYDCSDLTSVTIPNSVTSIGWGAFSGCSDLTTLNFNAINCQDFEAYDNRHPFYRTLLTTVNIGDGVQRIPAYFVRGCSGLTSVTIPNSVTSIGDRAFYGCSGLTSVTIPTGVTSIGEWAFSGCSGLTSVTIPNSVTSIGGWAFYGCSGLTTLNFNAINCQDFEAYYDYNGNYYRHFSGTSLTTVNIGDSVQRIPANFVSGCSGLTSITIPNGVTSIGEKAFEGCSGLTSINVASGNTHYSSMDGVLYNYVQDTLIQCLSAKTSVTIPNSVTSIGNSAFSGCSGLTSITIPNGVTSIGNSAFSGCSGLTSITIPNGVTSIGEKAFEGCSGLTTLNFNAINCQDFESSYFNGNYYGFGNSLTTVNIGDSVQRIPANFVSGCSGLTSVTIPTGVTSIGGGAFSYCSGLTSVTIPNSVTSIGGEAFSGCSGLTTLNFNAVNCQNFEVYSYAGNYYYTFSGTSLTTVNIGDSVQRIPANFVSGCSGLTSVTIPNSVTSIGGEAFYDCSGLTSITIPTGVTSIGGGYV